MKNPLIGPSVWALLILAAGFSTASLFVRDRSSNPESVESKGSDGLQADSASQRAGTSPVLPATLSSIRVVSGDLPGTDLRARSSTASVPDWAKPQSKLDELLAQDVTRRRFGAASGNSITGNPSNGNSSAALEALKPWTGAPHSSSLAAESTSGLAGLSSRTFSPWESEHAEVAKKSTTKAPVAWPDQHASASDIAQMMRRQAMRERSSNATQNQSSPAVLTAGGMSGAKVNEVRSTPRLGRSIELSSERERRFVYQPGYEPAK